MRLPGITLTVGKTGNLLIIHKTITMAKTKENVEATTEESQEQQQPETQAAEKKENPLKPILESISKLSQADRVAFYKHIDVVANHDKDKYSVGADVAPDYFTGVINSL